MCDWELFTDLAKIDVAAGVLASQRLLDLLPRTDRRFKDQGLTKAKLADRADLFTSIVTPGHLFYAHEKEGQKMKNTLGRFRVREMKETALGSFGNAGSRCGCQPSSLALCARSAQKMPFNLLGIFQILARPTLRQPAWLSPW
jgi:hypothetical protein